MKTFNRVLIIGLDGATWDVLDPWIQDGSLPNLAQLRRNGVWGDLLSTVPPVSAPAWSTFMTGKRPGKHGVFHFINPFREKQVEPEIVNARSVKSPAVWDILAHHQRQVVLINVPMTYPPRPVNGVLITGLLTPKNAPAFTYPPELGAELGGYVIDLERFIDKKPTQSGAFDLEATAPSLNLMRDFEDMLEKRARAALSLMDSRPWDAFILVFTGTDRMGHYLWPYHRHPSEDDPPGVQELCRAVHGYYVRLDERLGELAAQAGEDCAVIVMSDHGMGTQPTKWVHINNWLQEHNWLSAQKTDDSHVSNPDRCLRRLGLPRDKIGRIVRRLPGLDKSRIVARARKSRALAADEARSDAYCKAIYHNKVAGLYINPRLSDERRAALRREITDGIRSITDPETGQPVARQILLGAEYYAGPYAGAIPDLILSMEADYACNYSLGRYSGLVTERQSISGGGGHRPEGIFIAGGPGIAARSEALPNLDIEDIAPTLLYLLGLPVPSDMDGRALTEIMTPGKSRPVERGEPMGFWPSEEAAFSGDQDTSDDELVRERLQALGYLD